MPGYDVVFVDDEVSLTEIFQHYVLARYNQWRFLTFHNSQSLYKEITMNHLTATVWIIDLMMPGKNGVDIAESIRKLHGNKATLIAYTALDRDDLRRDETYASGLHYFDHVINKMEDPVSLLSLVDVWVQREQARNNLPLAAD